LNKEIIVKWFKLFVATFFPLAVLVLTALPFYGTIIKWEIAEKILKQEYSGKVAIMIGASSSYQESKNASYHYRERSYLVFDATNMPTVVSVSELNQDSRIEIKVKESFGAGVFYLVCFLFAVFCSIKYSIPFVSGKGSLHSRAQ